MNSIFGLLSQQLIASHAFEIMKKNIKLHVLKFILLELVIKVFTDI